MKLTETQISKKLRNLGVSANLYGYTYIKTALELISEDKTYWHRTTALYQGIARKHSTTVSKVEKAIRYAVEKAYLEGVLREIQELGAVSVSKCKLTNSAFIAALYEDLSITGGEENDLQPTSGNTLP